MRESETVATLPSIVPENYPGVSFTDAGQQRLRDVLAFLAEEQHAPDTIQEVLRELHERLEFLSGYGGDAWEVHLSRDSADLSFSAVWYRDGEAAFNGVLQFNGAPQPFGSVVIGPPTWWSIHT